MTRRRHCREKVDDSPSEADDAIFSDVDAVQETDLTCDDDDDNDNDVNYAQDQSDLADFLADNEHPPQYYIDQLKNFDETIYNQEDYSSGTQRMLDRVEGCWNGFCSYTQTDPVESYSALSAKFLGTFLEWVLNLRRGKGGRRLRGIKTKSSLQTFWKVFRLVHERATGDKIDPVTTRQMKRVIRHLSKKYHLKKKGRAKSVMYVEDLAKVVETTVVTTRKKFGHGRHRIELCLFLQLAGLTTNRPQAILDLCYRHILVTLLRDPCGGPHRILIELTFEFTKEFLGAKDENTFPLPEIIFDPSLVLSPHVFLLGLLFADRAFRCVDGEEVLVSAEQLLRLYIRPECNELQFAA
ncbi:conserved hypothetical protein [Talaromyces stipitatus ATCC 10500]|uniref:C2H2 finger domain protein n=1 Tax=Talaromyces stipitatus (strain ATCC 10500 / CBS 375.48 / QM 6759 / NRRL 1006) TaxID=441959 RepID=B8MV19_TALSN|nr:uncharacterized protein TSTA_110880 [Talaromyces stipitatus ATCC 10500]EED11909.1 conserved hypothetical protein [Talaromyces stipitatus ATCC 10500]